MMWKLHLVIISCCLCYLSAADTLDIGDTDQYEPKLSTAPAGILPNGIWLGQGDGGINLALGQDVLSAIYGVLQECGDDDNGCYQNVTNVFTSGEFQVDTVLNRRDFKWFLWKTFKKYGSIFDIVYTYLKISWMMKHEDLKELGIWIPDRVATSAGLLATATELTLSATGTAVATITKAPEATFVQDTAPYITSITSPDDKHYGNLTIILDPNLAARIDEYMHRANLDCKDGRDFDAQNPSRKRAGGTYGQAICAAEAAVTEAVPGGPFEDLIRMGPAGFQWQLADIPGAAFRAANVLATFVNGFPPMLIVPTELLDQLVVYLIAFAIDTIVELTPLGSENPIKASLIHTETATPTSVSATTTSSSACPDPTKITCGMTGATCGMKMPEKGKDTPLCEDGPNKDCPCSAPPMIFLNIMSPADQQSLVDLSALLNSITLPAPSIQHPICPVVVTEMPANVFSSDQNKVYVQFCQEWNSKQALKMTVNSTGNNKNPARRMKQKRTPPPNAATYSDWSFDLGYTPSSGGENCSTDCNSAWAQITSACSSNAGGVYMYEQGSLDVGCGTLEYKVNKPLITSITQPASQAPASTTSSTTTPTLLPPSVGPQGCYAIESHQDTHDRTVSKDANDLCDPDQPHWNKGGKVVMDANSVAMITNAKDWWTDANDYWYGVGWIKGCQTTAETQLVGDPMGDKTKEHSCSNLLWNNWKKCNNLGTGGWVDVGCLRYTFRATKNGLTDNWADVVKTS